MTEKSPFFTPKSIKSFASPPTHTRNRLTTTVKFFGRDLFSVSIGVGGSPPPRLRSLWTIPYCVVIILYLNWSIEIFDFPTPVTKKFKKKTWPIDDGRQTSIDKIRRATGIACKLFHLGPHKVSACVINFWKLFRVFFLPLAVFSEKYFFSVSNSFAKIISIFFMVDWQLFYLDMRREVLS